MSEIYDATYSAVSSRIGHPDVGGIIERAVRDSFYMGNFQAIAIEAVGIVAEALQRPSALYRPDLRLDGDQYCALYGEDLAVGVAGFGRSPAEAMDAFDKAWIAHR